MAAIKEALEKLDLIIEMFNKYANKPNDISEFFKFTKAHEIVKQALEQAENCLDARRNGKTLEQMYQLVKYSEPPMKPALWIAKIDDKLEQRVIIEKEEYDKLTTDSKKARAFDVIKEKKVNITAIMQLETVEDYNRIVIFKNGRGCENLFLTEEEFDLLKECLEK